MFPDFSMHTRLSFWSQRPFDTHSKLMTDLILPSKLRLISTESSLKMTGKLRVTIQHQSAKYCFSLHIIKYAKIANMMEF